MAPFSDRLIEEWATLVALRALAVASDKRLAVAPELPTMAEAGVPGVEVSSWSAFLVVVIGSTPDELARFSGALALTRRRLRRRKGG